MCKLQSQCVLYKPRCTSYSLGRKPYCLIYDSLLLNLDLIIYNLLTIVYPQRQISTSCVSGIHHLFIFYINVTCRQVTHKMCGNPSTEYSSGELEGRAHGQELREYCLRFACCSIFHVPKFLLMNFNF